MLFNSVLVALFAAVATAQVHAPTTQGGNPIFTPGLNEEVPKGKAYTITWDPTTEGPVSFVLRKGPSENNVPIATLAEGLPNSGSFVWTPSEALETTGDRFYGLQIVDDVTGEFQYSTQFGLTGETVKPSTSLGYPTSTPEGYPTGAPSTKEHSTKIHVSSSVNYTSGYPTLSTSSHVASTGYPVSNSSIVLPTKTPTVPVTLRSTTSETATPPPSSTSGGPPESTGAASGLSAGFGLAGVLAVAAAFL